MRYSGFSRRRRRDCVFGTHDLCVGPPKAMRGREEKEEEEEKKRAEYKDQMNKGKCGGRLVEMCV